MSNYSIRTSVISGCDFVNGTFKIKDHIVINDNTGRETIKYATLTAPVSAKSPQEAVNMLARKPDGDRTKMKSWGAQWRFPERSKGADMKFDVRPRMSNERAACLLAYLFGLKMPIDDEKRIEGHLSACAIVIENVKGADANKSAEQLAQELLDARNGAPATA